MSDELEKLLSELELDSDSVDEDEDEDIVEENVAPEPVKLKLKLVSEPEPPPVVEANVIASQEPQKTAVIASTTDIVEQSAGEIIDIRKIVKEHDRDYALIASQLMRDRSKIDQILGLLVERLDDGTAKNAEIEAITRVLQTLTDTNGHHVRLLDSRSKLMTSTKSSIGAIIQNNMGSSVDNEELKKLLERTVESEFDV